MPLLYTQLSPFNFKGKIISQFPGYNSAGDKTSLPVGTLIRGSKNVYKKISGTIASRPGLKRRGSADSTDAGVKSSYEWNTNSGFSRPLRVCNNKLQVESDIITSGTPLWYDLLTTSTLAHPAATLTRFVFDTWWDDDEKRDRLIMVRGDDRILHWSGGMTLVSSTSSTTTGITTVTVNNGGTGYELGEVLTLAGGTGGTVVVTTRSGNTITGVELVTHGTGYSTGTGITTTASLAGTGATMDIGAVGTYYSLTKQGAETWAELGFATEITEEKKLIINGAEYTYGSGEDTTTLQEVTPDPTLLTSGLIIIQSVISSPASDATGRDFDFIKTINNQVWYGSYYSRVIFLSADITAGGVLGFLNLEDDNDHVPGDPSSIILDGPARGIGVASNGKILVFSGDSDMVIVTPNENVTFQYDIGSNTQLAFNKLEKKNLAGLTSALGHEFIGNIGEYLVWIDQKNRLRALGTFTNVTAIKPVNLSLQVQDELYEDDFTGGHLRVIDDTIYITAPINGRDWMYQIRETLSNSGEVVTERLWHSPQVRGIQRFAVIDGITYGHSNVNPQVYQIWDTNQWFDDNPTDEPIPYACVARFSYQQADRHNLCTFNTIYFEGYMVPALELNANIYLDYQGTSGRKLVNINNVNDSAASFFMGIDGVSLGDSSLGDNPLGSGIIVETNEQELLPKFRAITDVSLSNFFEYSIEIFSYDADSRWELLCFGTNQETAIQDPGNIRK